ncbi:MAG: aminopeptidase, partial [Pseudomonadota bacterium]
LDPWERRVFDRAVAEDGEYYVLEFSNVGGLVMPIILGFEFTDGTTEKVYIPAEIWRRNPHRVSKLFVFERGQELSQIIVDPDWETADADLENNYYPRRITPSRVEAFKFRNPYSFDRRDIMQDIKTELLTDEELTEDDDEKAGE